MSAYFFIRVSFCRNPRVSRQTNSKMLRVLSTKTCLTTCPRFTANMQNIKTKSNQNFLSIAKGLKEEVEKKFRPTFATIKIVEAIAERKREKTFTDHYYDINGQYTLTTKDFWMRKRDSVFELKWPNDSMIATQNLSASQGIDFYHESTDPTTISNTIKSLIPLQDENPSNEGFEEWLTLHKLTRFAAITTHRTRYFLSLTSIAMPSQVHVVHVDIDRVTYASDLDVDVVGAKVSAHYEIGEVELVRAANTMQPAQALAEVFQVLEIPQAAPSVRGKVLEYLHRFVPSHYLALYKSGLLKNKLDSSINPKQTVPMAESQSVLRELLANAAVNYHFTRKCNFGCKFCFHTTKSEDVLPLSDALVMLQQVRDVGVEKINFAGGEPFLPLYHEYLGAMVKHCKETMGYESVSIISNNSTINEAWLQKYGKYLDILGISCDTIDPSTNLAHGRYAKGNIGPSKELNRLGKTAELCRKYGIKLKINTVVTKVSKDEIMAELINKIQPMRWKVFQVLPLKGENYYDEGEDGGKGDRSSEASESKSKKQSTKKKGDVRKLLITKEEFDQYINRNRSLLDNPNILKDESNEVMQSSYLLIDEYGRFLDSSTGSKLPTKSILEVGVAVAFRELARSKGGGFNKEMYLQRDGFYPNEWKRD